MNNRELSRKLVLRAPPDLLAAVYARVRGREQKGVEVPSWPEIVRAAQRLGIFTAAEARAFLEVVNDRLGDAAQNASVTGLFQCAAQEGRGDPWSHS